MGWDVTDFGSGRFEERGLVVFCVRNGLQKVIGEKPYAEKLLIVRENQETPFHFHKVKMEDIIVRGGGNLMLEFHNSQKDGGLAGTPVRVMVDGVEHQLKAGEPIPADARQNVTVTAPSGTASTASRAREPSSPARSRRSTTTSPTTTSSTRSVALPASRRTSRSSFRSGTKWLRWPKSSADEPLRCGVTR